MLCRAILLASTTTVAMDLHGQDAAEFPAESRLLAEIHEGVYSRLSLVPYGSVRDPVESRINRRNYWKIAKYTLNCDARPDLGLTFRALDLSLQPRFDLLWEQWELGPKTGQTQSSTGWYMQEWLARARLRQDLFVSFGRENLQWGPAFLLSPSNPFNTANGRENTKLEVPGLDYARAVWVADSFWAMSLIANTGKGRQSFSGEFSQTLALKTDYSGDRRYVSAIVSKREEHRPRLGVYSGADVSDAVLLHAEGGISRGDDGQGLLGASYTLKRGTAFALEYYYNGRGCKEERIRRCFSPFGEVLPEDGLFRRNYLLLQCVETGIKDRTNLTMRWTAGLDDGSNRATGIMTSDLTEHVQLFAVATVDTGRRSDEFGSLFKYAVMLGFSIIY